MSRPRRTLCWLCRQPCTMADAPKVVEAPTGKLVIMHGRCAKTVDIIRAAGEAMRRSNGIG